jgi:hypothetical protein
MFVLAHVHSGPINTVLDCIVCNKYKESVNKLIEIAQAISDENNFPTEATQWLIKAHENIHLETESNEEWDFHFTKWLNWINSNGNFFDYTIKEFKINVVV